MHDETRATHTIPCSECGAEDQLLKTVSTDSELRTGRAIYTEEVVFICEECGFFSRELSEERRNTE